MVFFFNPNSETMFSLKYRKKAIKISKYNPHVRNIVYKFQTFILSKMYISVSYQPYSSVRHKKTEMKRGC